jgi:hypothetical protein
MNVLVLDSDPTRPAVGLPPTVIFGPSGTGGHVEHWIHAQPGDPDRSAMTETGDAPTAGLESPADTDEEGWFTDPFLVHDERWLSNGRPTKLVKDGGFESFDPPPDRPPTQTPTRVEADPKATGGTDLQRADDAQSGEVVDPSAFRMMAWDSFGSGPIAQHLWDGTDY